MFGGTERRRSSNVRFKQLFHELKQQFPTIADEVIASRIAERTTITSTKQPTNEPMGRSSSQCEVPGLDEETTTVAATAASSSRESTPDGDGADHPTTVSRLRQQFESPAPKCPNESAGAPKRPTTLDLDATKRGKNTLRTSEKCNNLPKLLNSNILNDKPPRSPVHNKKPPAATGARKKETVSTPTQTTDTLLLGADPVNVVSFNVNCSMDVIRSPVPNRRSTTLQVTPETPWLASEPTSPRSYTSVNLTLRPPSSTPQPPIDITSKNASLTYSTSSFDSQKGLQSRLQITVGPGGGNVTSSRISALNSSTPATAPAVEVPEPPVLIKQQVRIERLRIELTDQKTRLIVLRKEVADLDKKTGQSFAEVQRKELKLKIAHLRFQCQKLAQSLNDFGEPEFYNNLYRGQPLDVNADRRFLQRDRDYPKWACHVCTFLNHPQLNKCEQCEMPRFIQVSAAPGDNIHIHVTPRMSSRVVRSWLL